MMGKKGDISMRLLSRSRELKRLDSIFKRTGQRSVQLLDSVIWLRGCKRTAVRAPAWSEPQRASRRSPIDFGSRSRTFGLR
jgi:hypothetical protein